jgi:hypothetical protein
VPLDTRGYAMPAPCVALVPAEGMLPVERTLRAMGQPPIGLVPPQPFPACLSLDVAGMLLSRLHEALVTATRAVPPPGVLPAGDETGERAAIGEEWAGGAFLLWMVCQLEAIVIRSRDPRWRSVVLETPPGSNAVVREARRCRRLQAVRQAIGDDLSATEGRTAVLGSTAMQGGDRRSNDGYFVVLIDTWRRPLSHLVLEVVRYLRHMGTSGALGGLTSTVVCNGWDTAEWITLHRQAAEEMLAAQASMVRVASQMTQFMLVLWTGTRRRMGPRTGGRGRRQYQRADDIIRCRRLSLAHEFEMSAFLATTELRFAVLVDLILGCTGYPLGCLPSVDCQRFARHAAAFMEGFMAI